MQINKIVTVERENGPFEVSRECEDFVVGDALIGSSSFAHG